jgi:dTDP-4-amino-4,6-dideoxy-D-galactose acyltransferase
MTSSVEVCEFLDWDSNFFDYRIGRVKGHYLTDQLIKDIDKWVTNNGIDCLYFLAESDTPKTSLLAHQFGFQLVDIRMTYEYNLETIKVHSEKKTVEKESTKIRRARPEDIPALKSIARMSYNDSRFHFDRHFPKEKSDALYEIWIERSCDDYADNVLIAELENQAVGYITCKIVDKDTGQIGLVGVAELARGRGIGKSLIYSSLNWFANENLQFVIVATQGRNISAQRLYQNCGFMTRSVQLWYHKWTQS